MKLTRLSVLTAVAVAASLAVGDRAHASYDYTAALSITSVSAGTFTNSATGASATFGGTTLTLSNVARTGFTVPGVNTVNLGDVAVTTTTVPPSADSFFLNYTDVITFTNVPPPGTAGSASVTLSGTLTLSNISTGSGTITNVYLPPTSGSGVIGGISFTGVADDFGNPTINGAPGNLGGTITAAVVPEPSSVVLVGIGIATAGLIAWRRRRVAA